MHFLILAWKLVVLLTAAVVFPQTQVIDGTLVAARHKVDWIYVTTTVTYIAMFNWELDPGILIKAPI